MKRNYFWRVIWFPALLALTTMACGSFDLGSIFATATPTPTATFTPTFTPTPTPTATPTATPTPLPTGMDLQEQADGSTLFIDYDNRFQLVIPSSWVVLPLTIEDVATYLEKFSKDNPDMDLETIVGVINQLDQDLVRVIAIPKGKKYLKDGFIANITVLVLKESLLASMPLDFVSASFEETTPQGMKIVATAVPAAVNLQGVETTQFEFEQTSPTVTGANVRVRSGLLLFQTKDALVMVQLTTHRQFGGELMPILNQIRDSIQPFEP